MMITETEILLEQEAVGQQEKVEGESVNKATGGGNRRIAAKRARQKAEKEANEKAALGREEKERVESNGRWTSAERGPSPTEPTTPAPKPGLEAPPKTTPELFRMPKEVKDEVPTTPKTSPVPSLGSLRRSQVPTPSPVPAKTEPEKPLSLWERKKPKAASPPTPGSSLFGGGDGIGVSVWGDTSGGGNAESVAIPTVVGDRQSVFADTDHDRKARNQRGNVVAGHLSTSSARRRNDPTPAPPLKSSGWGSWRGSLIANIADQAIIPQRSPSPGPPFGSSFGSGIKNLSINTAMSSSESST